MISVIGLKQTFHLVLRHIEQYKHKHDSSEFGENLFFFASKHLKFVTNNSQYIQKQTISLTRPHANTCTMNTFFLNARYFFIPLNGAWIRILHDAQTWQTHRFPKTAVNQQVGAGWLHRTCSGVTWQTAKVNESPSRLTSFLIFVETKGKKIQYTTPHRANAKANKPPPW